MKYQAALNSADYDEDKEIDAEIRIEEKAEHSIVKTKKIRARRRGARHQENSARAKSISDSKPVPAQSQKHEEEIVNVDNEDWDIDYV
tara:strand:- start:1244 stop:1507 length:264 start_codon:yes stop_codon:yes gene_type:complete